MIVVVPVKRLDRAKSRLRPDVMRASDLALAFAADTVEACAGARLVQGVVVVTSDAEVSRAVSGISRVVPDPGLGLNLAIEAALSTIAPDAPAAVLTGDLPAVRALDLDEALGLAALHDRAMVADHTGSGTTLITARRTRLLRPQYGERSRERHERGGHVVLDVDGDSALRRDVDTRADLEAVLRMGVGAHTARAVAAGAALDGHRREARAVGGRLGLPGE